MGDVATTYDRLVTDSHPPVGPHDTYLANQALIERALAQVCQRQQLSPADADDYRSAFRLHIMKDDYAAIRAFRGRSSLQTFLIVVMTRFYQDWRNARWGKWRPSAEARRQGHVAVCLETLMLRDGLAFGEAFEVLKPRLGPDDTRARLEAVASRFRPRVSRAAVSDEGLHEMAGASQDGTSRLARREAVALAERAAQALDTAVEQLSAEDRSLLRMRFEDDISVADIARTLNVDQKGLYRRVDRVLTRLRAALEDAGLDADAAAQVLEHRGFDGPEAS